MIHKTTGNAPKPVAGGSQQVAAPRLGSPERTRRLLLLAVLVGTLALVVGYGTRFLIDTQQGTAVAPLPPLAAVTSAVKPRFLFSVNGVSRPLGVAVSPTGNRIYVTESDGDRETKIFDRDGHPLGALNPPGVDSSARIPVYVAVSPQGKVFVSDRRMGALYQYSPEGEYQGKVEPPAALGTSWSPLALNFDAQGRLLVTDVTPGQHRVVVLDASDALVQQFGKEGTGEGEFSYPNGVASDRAGRFLVADSNNGRITVLDPAGNSLWSFGRSGAGGSLGLPRGLVVDDQNRAYVADTVNHNLQIFELGDRSAKLLYTLGEQGIKDGQFGFPNGVAIDQSGRLYITDRENNRVQVWTY